jgi:hypothetical protein
MMMMMMMMMMMILMSTGGVLESSRCSIPCMKFKRPLVSPAGSLKAFQPEAPSTHKLC